MANDRWFRVVRGTDSGLTDFDGPFPHMEVVVLVAYNGVLLNRYWLFELV